MQCAQRLCKGRGFFCASVGGAGRGAVVHDVSAPLHRASACTSSAATAFTPAPGQRPARVLVVECNARAGSATVRLGHLVKAWTASAVDKPPSMPSCRRSHPQFTREAYRFMAPDCKTSRACDWRWGPKHWWVRGDGCVLKRPLRSGLTDAPNQTPIRCRVASLEAPLRHVSSPRSIRIWPVSRSPGPLRRVPVPVSVGAGSKAASAPSIYIDGFPCRSRLRHLTLPPFASTAYAAFASHSIKFLHFCPLPLPVRDHSLDFLCLFHPPVSCVA